MVQVKHFYCLYKEIAHQKNLCVCRADLAPEKRLYSTSGHARTLYAELIRQLSNKLKPQGDGLQSLVEKILTKSSISELEEKFKNLNNNSLGFDFYNVLITYKKALINGDIFKQNSALRWMKEVFNKIRHIKT